MVHANDSQLVENKTILLSPSSSKPTFKRPGEQQDQERDLNLNSNSVIVEEFPRGVERTEIVRLKDVKTRNSVNTGAYTESTFDRSQVQRRISPRFSLFNWFKKNPNNQINRSNESINNDNKNNSYVRNENGFIYSSNLSVDTTCSTATVHSFTFRRPGRYGDSTLSKRRRFELFRKHYSADDFRESATSNKFDSELSINNHSDKIKDLRPASISAAEIKSGESKSKEKIYDNYRSLPISGKTADLANVGKKRCAHVRGKRKAPKPPGLNNLNDNTLIKDFNKINSPVNTRRKRQAPKPPTLQSDKKENFINRIDDSETKKCWTNCIRSDSRITFGREEEEEGDKNKVEDGSRMLKESLLGADNNNKKGEKNLPAIVAESLRLEEGFLSQSKDIAKRDEMANQIVNIKQDKKLGDQKSVQTKRTGVLLNGGQQNSHVQAPRPWYKRSNTTLSERDICGSFKREVFKIPTLNKLSKDKGIARLNQHELNSKEANDLRSEISNQEISQVAGESKSFSRLNHFFGRNDNQTCKTKKEEKRKSNLSILTNISELDREAAAIVQEEQARNQAILSRSFPTSSNDLGRSSSGEIISEIVSSSIEPQRRGTRALISKFNAISNITKVTVNATFFAKSSSSSSSSANQSNPAKIDVVRGAEQRGLKTSKRNDRIVTKRLLYDGEEKVNETGDISSINFFRRLEAEASKTPDNNVVVADAGWEEKIKRYFPEREKKRSSSGMKEFIKKEPEIRQRRESRNVDKEFEYVDSRNRRRDPINVDKIEHLSRADLKEMLIEMKHSLPKRPKPKSTGKTNAGLTSDEKIVKNSQHGILNHQKPTTSLSYNKVTTSKLLEVPNNRKSSASGEEETALVVDKKKVSSGVQTSANLRKIELPSAKDKRESYKSGGKSENTIYTTRERNAGGASLARNTFQLIRPRDFACIEALKTEKGGGLSGKTGAPSQNTYMNVIEDSIYANTMIQQPEIRMSEKVNDHKKLKLNENKIDLEKREKKIHSDAEKKTNRRYYTASVVADIKPEIRKDVEGEQKSEAMETNMNTLAINRLLRKLEGAIASGQHQQAAGLAKELAQLKIHCSVVRQRSAAINVTDFITVDMYIEDKLAHQGPIPLQLSLNMTVADLKKKVLAEFEIPENVQRWIIGKNLADNDNFTIAQLKAVDKSSIFLYLVAPDLQNDETTKIDVKPVAKEEEERDKTPVDEEQPDIVPIVEEEKEEEEEEEEDNEEAEIKPEAKEPTVEELKLKRYEHLMSLENSDVIPNSVPIECPICFAPYGPCEGIILRDCLHMFCRSCIANTIMYCDEAEVKCPFRDSEYTCESTLQEREIKALVTPEVYEQHLAKSVSQAENSAGNNAFHCKTPDCRGWCIYDDNVNTFLCPVCDVNNCLTCQAIHADKNCREYQDELRLLKETDQETKRTAAVLEEMVESGEALACPTCAVVLMKKWGCDWLRCSMCKTEICWVTRGPRWGPAGKGDTSGGCKCGENGVKCHPRCNYCH